MFKKYFFWETIIFLFLVLLSFWINLAILFPIPSLLGALEKLLPIGTVLLFVNAGKFTWPILFGILLLLIDFFFEKVLPSLFLSHRIFLNLFILILLTRLGEVYLAKMSRGLLPSFLTH